MKKFVLFYLASLISFASFAQQITGKVTDTGGEGLPGVSVTVSGSTVGTTSDVMGNYKINAKKGDVLKFSFIGMLPQEVVIGNETVINVSLADDTQQLGEVVVTAFGVNKEKRTLGYSIQSIDSKEIVEGNQNNVINTLQGKIAGVTVTNSGGAPGASSVIMIRGGTSITGNNQPLIIVDGIPIDNSTDGSLEVASINRASDLNPQDIESMTVLKGPAAAALYGIQAASGAVVITTKKGKEGKVAVNYNGSVSTNTVLGTPDIQQRYGRGEQILGTDGSVTYNLESPLSWGPQISAGTPVYNHLTEFYQTGYSYNHNVSVSGGTEKSRTYFSLGDLTNNGVIPTTSYDKTSFRLTNNTKLNNKLNVGATVNYIKTDISSTRQGNATGGSYTALLSYPSDVDIFDYVNPDGSQKPFYVDQMFDNPYWSQEYNPSNNQLNRFMGILNLDYNVFKGMNIAYKFGADIFDQHNKSLTSEGSLVESRKTGFLTQYERLSKRYTSNLIATYDVDLNSNLNLSILAGNTVEDLNLRTVYLSGLGFVAPGIHSISNIDRANQTINEGIARRRGVAAFGEVKLSYKNALFFNVTGRNDWSSTLPADKRSFFYPSAGVAAVLTDLFDMNTSGALSYLKVRGTFAQVGKDAPIGQLESYLSTNINGLASSGYTWNGVDVGNPSLEPEFTNSFEVGAEARFYQNRIGLDMTYYSTVSDNQILTDIRVPPTAGTFYATLNGGSIQNKGFEALLNFKVLPSTAPLQWNSTFNFARNESKVNALPGQIQEVYLSDSWTFLNSAAGAGILNGSLFALRGKRAVRNENGDVVIGANGYPVLTDQTYTDIDRQPTFTLGLTNSFRYKNAALSFLFDISYGNTVYNATASALAYYGVGANTLDRGETTVIEGVTADGSPNTTAVTKNQRYYQTYYALLSDNFVEDGSYGRMRYINLSYNFDKKIFANTPIAGIEIYATARNLFTITNYSGVDPEINSFGGGVSGAGSVGIDNLSTPNTKGFDLGLKVNF